MQSLPASARALAAALLVAACGEEPRASPAEIAAAARPETPEAPPEVAPPPRLAGEALRIHRPADLEAFEDLATLRDLDLALSEVDRADLALIGEDEGDPCEGLDLRALAGRLP
ncbi:MAG: hypothetical protein KC420_22150, partial [Myxococcales bacterium]|nr:hypothetical protein [Myxococcales bacterium]